MEMNMIDFQAILSTWQPFHTVSDIGHIKNEAHYDRMVALADHLVESGAANDGHELEDLFLLICDLIGQYDDQHYAPAEVTPSCARSENIRHFCCKRWHLHGKQCAPIKGVQMKKWKPSLLHVVRKCSQKIG
jgi:hypothetical protein